MSGKGVHYEFGGISDVIWALPSLAAQLTGVLP
jgi:hypothetical protein